MEKAARLENIAEKSRGQVAGGRKQKQVTGGKKMWQAEDGRKKCSLSRENWGKGENNPLFYLLLRALS
jgi:hypothetical protein